MTGGELEESEFVSVDKENANRTLSHLLSLDAVRKDLKIRFDGKRVFIPVKQSAAPEQYRTTVGTFQSRDIVVSPTEKIRKLMKSRGSFQTIPPKFIRLGRALIFKDSRLRSWTTELLKSTAEQIGVDSIYVDMGIGSSVRREPDIRLVYGPGGDTVHPEGGIRYCLDPAKIMFSPGNVNIRISKAKEDLNGKTILDMFAGIGYFSLQAASTARNSTIYSCEINPVSFHYLEKNIELNSLAGKIKPIQGDCRKLPLELVADHIIMGHFDCLDYIAAALLHSRGGTTIDFHVLVDTVGIQSEWADVVSRAKQFGYLLDFIDQQVVKSYGPHLWHIVIKASVTGVPF